MCGLIGIVGKIPTETEFIKARDVLAHRGPNDAGVFYDEKNRLALGHRRLSIIDLSHAGHQPMFSNDRRYSIVFNGELYNYLELKEELKNSYNFQTLTDTEVILASYIIWGQQCLERLNGMFTFVICDHHSGNLFCVRDRLGIKPFYYYIDSNIFAFASEIKGLLALGIKAQPNDGIIYDYLHFGFYDHNEETFFKDILRLPPGHFIYYASGSAKVKCWWDLSKAQPENKYISISKEEAQECLKELMADSIKLQFRSDVPVGVNISSGLDSTSLLFYAEQTTKEDLHLFSMCLSDSKFDECQFIRPILNINQLNRWHTSTLEYNEAFPLASVMLNIQDEPYGGIPTIAYYKLNEAAQKQGVIVLLEGQGVDEILAGYNYYYPEFIKDLIKFRDWQKLKDYLIFKKGEKVGYIESILDLLSFSRLSTATLSQDLTSQLSIDALSRDFVLRLEGRNFVFKQPFESKLLNAQYRDIRYLKLPRVLRFNDHVSMHFGRELRVPYLDHRIVEFCFYLPAEYKIESGRQKVLLRDAMKTSIPESTSARSKVAFGAVQTPWLRNYFKKEVMDILESASFKQRPYWDWKVVINRAGKFFNGEGNNSFFIWQWINLEMWLRKYID